MLSFLRSKHGSLLVQAVLDDDPWRVQGLMSVPEMSNSRCLRQLTKEELLGLIEVAEQRQRPKSLRFLQNAVNRLHPSSSEATRDPPPYHSATVHSHKRQQPSEQQRQEWPPSPLVPLRVDRWLESGGSPFSDHRTQFQYRPGGDASGHKSDGPVTLYTSKALNLSLRQAASNPAVAAMYLQPSPEQDDWVCQSVGSFSTLSEATTTNHTNTAQERPGSAGRGPKSSARKRRWSVKQLEREQREKEEAAAACVTPDDKDEKPARAATLLLPLSTASKVPSSTALASSFSARASKPGDSMPTQDQTGTQSPSLQALAGSTAKLHGIGDAALCATVAKKQTRKRQGRSSRKLTLLDFRSNRNDAAATEVAKEEARAANESHSATTASNVRASTDLTRSQERAAGVGLLDPSAPTPQMRQRVAV